jgi:hypothetical protein
MIPAALRAGARGLYADKAARELLINHASWLHRRDFTGRFLHTCVSITDDTQMASIDWPAAITGLDCGELPCSSEGKTLRLAASIGEGVPVNLRHALVGLDHHNLHLIQQAVLHTGGHRPPL